MKKILLLALAALPLAASTDWPNVKKLGKTVAQYQDDRVQIVVGYRHAQTHLNARWILLDTYLSASDGPITIDREDVSLTMPDGTRLNLPSQKRMAQGLPDLRRMLQEAGVSRDPLDGYFLGRNHEERLGFFTIPGEDIVFNEVSVNHQTLAHGDLFFESPKGKFEPGIYTLEIRNKQVHLKLPLALGIEGELERVK